MRTFLYCEAGFVEKDQWLPNSWINVECPTPEDIHYLTNQFNVPEFLNRHIGERVDLDCCGECGHDSRTKTIYQPLHHQYSEIHHGLLDASQCGERSDFFQAGTVEAHIFPV